MKTIKLNGIEITVRGPATVQDDLNATIISRRLQENAATGEWGYWQIFGELCAQTESAAGLSFEPVGLEKADNAALSAAYAAFLKLPKRLKDRWQTAVNELNVFEDGDPN